MLEISIIRLIDNANKFSIFHFFAWLMPEHISEYSVNYRLRHTKIPFKISRAHIQFKTYLIPSCGCDDGMREWYPCIKSIWDSMLSKRILKMCKASNWCVCDIWHEPNSMHFFRLMFIYHILMVLVVVMLCLYCVYVLYASWYAHTWWPNVFYSIRNFLFVMHTKTLKQYKIASTFLKFNLILWTMNILFLCVVHSLLSKKFSVCLKCMLYDVHTHIINNAFGNFQPF